MPQPPKLQRWTDLLAALLRRRYPAPFDQLKNEVPAYHAYKGSAASLMRMFERDKDELRAFGVPIETLPGADGNVSLYRLASAAFYLPYLQLANDTRPPKRPKGMGYQALPVLQFEPDELTVLAHAARRVRSLGEPALAAEAESAIRKLGHDLPIDAAAQNSELVVSEPVLDDTIFDALAAAVRNRKTITFQYHSMERDERSTRRADPYGIVYVSGNWYAIARDHGADALRQYRVRRMSDIAVDAKPQSPDFDVPAGFDIWEHARSRQSWELGDADVETIVVEFALAGGDIASAMRLGAPVPYEPQQRAFQVRRRDVFLRWILGFAGAARPVSPAAVVNDYARLVRSTRALYERTDAAAS